MIRAIGRWFRLREIAVEMSLPVHWWWGNGRLLQAVFDARVRQQKEREARIRSIFTLPKNTRRLDFRPSETAAAAAKTPAKGGW